MPSPNRQQKQKVLFNIKEIDVGVVGAGAVGAAGVAAVGGADAVGAVGVVGAGAVGAVSVRGVGAGVSVAKGNSAAKKGIALGKRPLPPQFATALAEAKSLVANLEKFKKTPNPKPSSAKKRKRSLSGSDSDYSGATSESDTSSSSSEEEDRPLATARRSHHVKAKCRMPGCKAVVGDQRRHLRTRQEERIGRGGPGQGPRNNASGEKNSEAQDCLPRRTRQAYRADSKSGARKMVVPPSVSRLMTIL